MYHWKYDEFGNVIEKRNYGVNEQLIKWVIAAVDFNRYVSIRVVFLREVDIVNETVMRSFFGRANCAQRHLMVLVWFFSGQETLEQTAL